MTNPEPKKKIAIVYPWPGYTCAESEFNVRAKKALTNIGYEGVIVSNNGRVLDDQHIPTDRIINPHEFLFALCLHYSSAKLFDSFYYYAIWNPPELPLANQESYHKAAQNMVMYDDYLVYSRGRMYNHLQSVLINSPRELDGASSLVSSFPADSIMEPNLKNPTLFYCGMNWEKVAYRSGHRHEGLLKLLDQTGGIKFFGPDKVKEWGGVRAWEGFSSYCGPIPFDGFSIVKEINACGVALVISSDNHRRSAAATNRVYEACAAGAVIISDNNAFVQEHFRDAALFIEFRKDDPDSTFSQIMEKFNWIKNHPDEAKAMALRAQDVFLQKFTLEKQFKAIIDNHPNRQAAVARSLYARRQDENILAVYVLDEPHFDDTQKQKLAAVIGNIENQIYSNITLAIGCDENIVDAVKEFCKGRAIKLKVFSYPIYDLQRTRLLTDGTVYCHIRRDIPHDYFIFMGPNEIWYADHIATLKRALEDNPNSVAAHAARVRATPQGYEWWLQQTFAQPELQALIQCRGLMPGQVLFKKEAESYIPDYAFEFLDGLEYFAFLLCAELRHGKKLIFSKRISFAQSQLLPRKSAPSLHPKSQARFIQDLVHYDYDYLCARTITQPAPYIRLPNSLLRVGCLENTLRKIARFITIESNWGCKFYNASKECLKDVLPKTGAVYRTLVKLNKFIMGDIGYRRHKTHMPELFD